MYLPHEKTKSRNRAELGEWFLPHEKTKSRNRAELGGMYFPHEMTKSQNRAEPHEKNIRTIWLKTKNVRKLS